MCPHGRAINLEHSSRQMGHSTVTPKISRKALTFNVRSLIVTVAVVSRCTMLQSGHLKDVPSDDGFLIVDIVVEVRLAQGISIMRSWDPRGDVDEGQVDAEISKLIIICRTSSRWRGFHRATADV